MAESATGFAYWRRLYARQRYMTPGAKETVALVQQQLLGLGVVSLVEIAGGKGEAAATLATENGATVTMVDRYPGFLGLARERLAEADADERVRLMLGDGRQLPFAADQFDGGYCIGAPSLVGLDDCISELARVVRPGGFIVVSDLVWRTLPEEPLGPKWDWVATWPPVTDQTYAAVLSTHGLTVEHIEVFPRSVWDAYHDPMQSVIDDARSAGDTDFADLAQPHLTLERGAADRYLNYAAFVARIPHD